MNYQNLEATGTTIALALAEGHAKGNKAKIAEAKKTLVAFAVAHGWLKHHASACMAPKVLKAAATTCEAAAFVYPMANEDEVEAFSVYFPALTKMLAEALETIAYDGDAYIYEDFLS